MWVSIITLASEPGAQREPRSFPWLFSPWETPVRKIHPNAFGAQHTPAPPGRREVGRGSTWSPESHLALLSRGRRDLPPLWGERNSPPSPCPTPMSAPRPSAATSPAGFRGVGHPFLVLLQLRLLASLRSPACPHGSSDRSALFGGPARGGVRSRGGGGNPSGQQCLLAPR